MAKKAPKAPTEPGVDGGKGKGKLKLILLAVIGLLLIASITAGVMWFLLGGKSEEQAAPEEHAAAEPAAPSPALYETLAPAFVVNFNHEGRQRYMQVSLALMGRDKASLDALKAYMPDLRNRLVMLFSSQNVETLMTPVGKEMLRQQATTAVQELAQQELGSPVIEQVLFTNLVLQ